MPKILRVQLPINTLIENTKHRMGKSLGINVTDMSAVEVLAAALNHIK